MENKVTEAKKTVQKRIEPKLKLINMDKVEVEQIEWLLYPFIPYGKVTIIQGDPGEGKTTMVLQIIARIMDLSGLENMISVQTSCLMEMARDRKAGKRKNFCLRYWQMVVCHRRKY